MTMSHTSQGWQGRWPRGAHGWAVLGVAFSAAMPSWGMDLMQAYDAALASDPVVRAAQAAAAATRERLPQAQAQLRPNVSLSVGRNSNDLSRNQQNILGQPVTTQESYYSFNQTLQVRQPLFRKPLWDGVSQAGYVVEDAEATLQRELQNLAVRVAGAYMEALLAQDQLDLVLKQQAVTRVQLDAATQALAAGAGTRTDIDEAQARLDMAAAQELEAQMHLAYTRHQLEVMVSQPVTEVAALSAERLAVQRPEPADMAAWTDLADSHSPEIRALQARVEAARLEVAKAKGGHYPTLDLVAQVTRSGSENVTSPSSSYTNRLVGVQMNLPLFSGGYVSATVRQAEAELIRAQENLEAGKRDLAVRLHAEFRGATEGVSKIRALEQAVRSAEQMVYSNQRSFEGGSRSRMDILNAEQQLQLTRRDLARARYQYLVSRVRLLSLTGDDVRPLLADINAWLVTPP